MKWMELWLLLVLTKKKKSQSIARSKSIPFGVWRNYSVPSFLLEVLSVSAIAVGEEEEEEGRDDEYCIVHDGTVLGVWLAKWMWWRKTTLLTTTNRKRRVQYRMDLRWRWKAVKDDAWRWTLDGAIDIDFVLYTQVKLKNDYNRKGE